MRWISSASLYALAGVSVLLLAGCGAADHTTPSDEVSTVGRGTQFAGTWNGTYTIDTNINAGLADNPATSVDESKEVLTIGGTATVTVSSEGVLTATLTNSTANAVGVMLSGAAGTVAETTVEDTGHFTGVLTSDKGTASNLGSNSLSGTLIFPVDTTNKLTISLTDIDPSGQHSGIMTLTRQN